MRNDALAHIKVACDAYGTVKTNVAKRCEALCKAGHVAETSVPPHMSVWARQFKDTLSKLKTEMKKGCFHVDAVISTSTLEKKVTPTISELDQVATSMAVQVKAI